MGKEQDKAKFYQQHKEDPEVWGEPEEGRQPVRRGSLSATITVRFSPEEVSEIRRWATKLDVSYSTIVRNAVRGFVRNASVMEQESNSFSGRPDLAKPREDRNWNEISLSTSHSRTSTQPLVLPS